MQETLTSCSGLCLVALPLSVVPSILWLLFFVYKDRHREKAKNIINVFLWGIIIALPVVIVESSFEKFIFAPLAGFVLSGVAYSFIAIAFVEEYAKYLVVRFRAMPYKFFDEPQDAMVYMISSALGFAAIENLLYALTSSSSAVEVLQISIVRGISATFLHVIASGALGYFIAISMEKPKEKIKFILSGLFLATLLHGIYNNFLINVQRDVLNTQTTSEILGVALVATFLIISGIIIIIGINKLAYIRFPSQSNKNRHNNE